MNEQKYSWSSDGTAVLISIWSDPVIQKQLRSTLRNQPIWDSVAHYMGQKGYRVNGKQCRTRIKNILVRYREIKKSGGVNGSSIEPYFQEIDRVMRQRNNHAAGQSSRSSGKSSITELQFAPYESKSRANQDVISVGDIKLEQDSPPDISEDSTQGTEEVSQDIPKEMEFFQAMDATVDGQQLSSSICAASPPSLHFFGQTQDVSTNTDNLHENIDQQPVQHAKADEDRTSAEKNTHFLSHLERLVLHTVRSQNEAVTQLMTMQNELVQRLLEADRERQARLELRMDRMLDRLDHLLPSSPNRCEENNRLNRVLDRLEWLIIPHSIQQQPVHAGTSKLEILLEKLDRFLPSLLHLEQSKSASEINSEQA